MWTRKLGSLQKHLYFVFQTRSDTNRATKPQKMARGLHIEISKQEALYMYYVHDVSRENRGGCHVQDYAHLIPKAGFLMIWLYK